MNKPILIIRCPNMFPNEALDGIVENVKQSKLAETHHPIVIRGTGKEFEFSLLTSKEEDFLMLNVELFEQMVHMGGESIEGLMDLKTKIDAINAWADNNKPNGDEFLKTLLSK